MSSEKVYSLVSVMTVRDCWCWLCSVLSLVMMSLEETARVFFFCIEYYMMVVQINVPELGTSQVYREATGCIILH